MDCPATIQAVRRMSQKWPEARVKLVEDKANGSAVIAMLKHEIEGLIAVNPEGGKESRVHAVTPQIEAGNVYLPDATLASWIGSFMDECAAFPHGAYDDQVDAMTQALLRLEMRRSSFEGLDLASINEQLCQPSYWRMYSNVGGY
jgi:predicted phage terminase large subunit-like protein